MTTVRRFAGGTALVALVLAAAACGSDDKSASTTLKTAETAATSTAAPGATSGTLHTVPDTAATATSPAPGGTNGTLHTVPTTGAGSGVTAEGISDAECQANKDAGKITYLSSFDFSASASIVDVIVAEQKGYFDKMCLDVDLTSGFSTTNYPLVASNQAQFSSAGNFTEILNFSNSGAEFEALVNYGKVPIEALVTKDPSITDLSQLKGKTIGVKGDIPPSIVAMLANAGLQRGTDYKEVLLDGFDPVAQLKQDIDALPVYKSNEPHQLDAAGVKYGLFDPAKTGTPGTFGLIYTSKDFADKHPTAVAGFTRAALHGMEDAMADPDAAVKMSVDMINAAGNQNFLTLDGETYRWTTESKIVKDGTPAGEPVGLIDADLFKKEFDTYKADGVWPKGAPTLYEAWDADLARSLYDSNGKVIWPAG